MGMFYTIYDFIFICSISLKDLIRFIGDLSRTLYDNFIAHKNRYYIRYYSYEKIG